MEGPVLTESEVWKVGSGASTSLPTEDQSPDYTPLVNIINDENLSKVSENTATGVQEEIKDQPDTKDQIKSERPIEEDFTSTQTTVVSVQTPVKQLDVDINQEITILVTNHDCTLEDEEDEEPEEQKDEPETASADQGGEAKEEDSLDGSIVVANMIEVSEVQMTNVINNTPPEPKTIPEKPGDPGDRSNEPNSGSKVSTTPQKTDTSSTNSPKDQATEPEDVEGKLKKTESTDSKDGGRPLQETLTLIRSPGRTQHVQTQVSLEVMYQSVATSPMTPPEGAAAFLFPTTFGKLANKCCTEAAQLQTKDVEMRSVATAPMTPIVLTAPELIPEPEPRIGVMSEEAPEPVQEVSWDEKGMTWEVYGAVVEVAVLGTAIQKHLEKQVKKQKNLPAPIDVPSVDLTETSTPMPSSPPPSSDPGRSSPDKQQSEEKEVQGGRRRQNTFRQWLRNIRRPSCCSRPRQDD